MEFTEEECEVLWEYISTLYVYITDDHKVEMKQDIEDEYGPDFMNKVSAACRKLRGET
jgi:hypothetical protein